MEKNKDQEISKVQEAAEQRLAEETKKQKGETDKIVKDIEEATEKTAVDCRTECEERLSKALKEYEEKVSSKN